MMRHRDLIAFLKPVMSQFHDAGRMELMDFTGQVTDIEANSYRLCLRMGLAAGTYRGRIQMKPRSFDMETASMKMIRVPDGERLAIGPWDLDHVHNVMAIPMVSTYVNGSLKGGLWFAMPGPEQIANGQLFAEFGFDAKRGSNELVLELIARDRERMNWRDLDFLELGKDDRRRVPLTPLSQQTPRIFLTRQEAEQAGKRWQGTGEFEALCEQLRGEDLVMLTDNSQGTLSLACIVFSFTGDEVIGSRARDTILELARAATWSGRPDPLLMGGENDRGISLRLFHIALAWDHLQPLLTDDDRKALLDKADEYLLKIYDFTVLQRAYMGYPAIDPHSLGSWNGAAIACMAFYDELEIARYALPFFHGLFCDSLKLFPASGKAAWATYFPFHLALYLAAAHTFAGRTPELSSSEFLDNLGSALLVSFEAPNSQELQRGLRTREHRFLTAFLYHFHPANGIDAIYRAFVQRERQAAGGLSLGMFDLLYAPDEAGPVSEFPSRPLFAKDVGDLIAISRSEHRVAVSVAGGCKAGRLACFTLMPQNREFAPSLGALEVAVDGTPVICNVNISGYGINSALTNAMCFDDGGGVTNGQYLNGAVRPEQCSVIRRCLLGERYVYAHIVLTEALDPALEVRQADRIFVFDRKTGTIVLSDAFDGSRPLRFATHLHCSGSVTDLGEDIYRLTGGQANLIAGIKRGSKQLDDAERGEIFVQVLRTSETAHVVVEEPAWVPGYIYGLNLSGHEELSDGRFPRYRRWRLECDERVKKGALLLALSLQPALVHLDGDDVVLPEGGLSFGLESREALGVRCECECLLWDKGEQRVTAIGALSLEHKGCHLTFVSAVDVEYLAGEGKGTAYSQSAQPPISSEGVSMQPWEPVGEEGWKTQCAYRASFERNAFATVTKRSSDERE
jgi:hypothetical protein